MLTNQAHLFSLPEGMHYLNCAYMSPLMKSVEAAGIEGVRAKRVPARITAGDFFAPGESLRLRMGQLVNAEPDRVALIPAVSYGVAIITHNVRLRQGQNVVTPGEEFPSNIYGWQHRCRRDGGELRIVPRPQDKQHAGHRWNDAIVDAIDGNTAIVSLTAVHWTDGTWFDLERIGARARQVGAAFIVDGTQSVGALPFDFKAVRPDALICAGYKWLLGPYGLGFIVMGDRFMEGTPIEMNWINREGSEDFSQLINYRDGYQPGARRYDVGERSNPILIPMLNAALRQLLDWGVASIQGYCAQLEAHLGEALAGTDFLLAPQAERASHLFGIRLPDPHGLPRVLQALQEREIYVSLRGTSVRVSPNVYNTPEDMHALVDALKAAHA